MHVKKATIVRTIILAVAIVNSILTSRGMGFKVFMNDQLANLLADLFMAVASIVAFWYNNSFTKEAIEADEYLADLRAGYAETEVDEDEE